MVLVASRRGLEPRLCAASVGPARPAGACWEEAAQAEAKRVTLPPFSLRSQAPCPPDPAAALERLAAAPPLAEAEVAEWQAAAALCPLTALRGPGDALQLQPQPVPLPGPLRGAGVPAFLLPRSREPLTDAWEQRAACTLDPPCLPSAADAEPEGQVRLACKEC